MSQTNHSGSLEELRKLAQFIVEYEFTAPEARWKSHIELTDYYATLIEQYTQSKLKAFAGEVKPLIERLELEFQIVVCDCGKPYKDTDPHNVLKELSSSLKVIKEKAGIE
jgi:hypothetical protein